MAAAAGLATTSRAAAPEPGAPCVVRASLGGVINNGSAEYLGGAIDLAEARGCQAVLIELDTPGGLVDATRTIVRRFLGSPVPVVVYVAPAGAHAGSAGMFVTIAAHVAAMAPATSIGAAHPVLGVGGGETSDVMEEKAVNDIAALARSIAVERGRNAEWAESAVRKSVSATDGEALALKVIDLRASSEEELLRAIDGRRIALPSGTVNLATAGAIVIQHQMSLRQRLVSFLGDPTVAYLLFMVGMLGLLIELSNPGLLVPGIAGAAALLFGVIGMGLLPINVGGVLLLVLGAALLIAEVYTASFGLFLLAGVASLLFGSALLVDPSDVDFFADPDLGVSWGAVVPIAATLAAVAAALAWQVSRTGRRRSPTGSEGLVGKIGVCQTPVDEHDGWVRVAGESWMARSLDPIPAGRHVVVRQVSGLSLEVEELHEGAMEAP